MSPSTEQTIDVTAVDIDYTKIEDIKMSMSNRILIKAKNLASISKELKQKITSAKTLTKKKYYTKKLKKNNDLLGDILIRLNQVRESEKNVKK